MATATGSYATATALKALLGITDVTDDTLIGLICDRVNQYIESTTRQILAPITSATYLYDGNGARRIFLPTPVNGSTLSIGGMRAVTLVEFAPETNGTFETIATTDYVLRGRKGMTGPYQWLLVADLPVGSYSTYPEGNANVRVTGTAGWSAIPDDLTEAALSIAANAWMARQMGNRDVIGQDAAGMPVVGDYVSGRARQVLKAYTLRGAV